VDVTSPSKTVSFVGGGTPLACTGGEAAGADISIDVPLVEQSASERRAEDVGRDPAAD
jgi:hypothetical protein